MRDLQRLLADLGYMPEEAVNGVVDERTAVAVLAFQKWSGLPAGRRARGRHGERARAGDAAGSRAAGRAWAGASRCCSTGSWHC